MTLSLTIPIGARARLARAWLGRRWPTAFLAIAVASFAIGPQWVLAGYLPDRLLMLAIPAQQLLLIAAAAANAARYRTRPGIAGWPLLAVLLLLAESLLVADRDPQLTGVRMAIAALDLALPWSLAAVVVEPGTRARYALLIALLPGLCVAIGFGLQAAGLNVAYAATATRVLRLQGASNAGWLACLAFAGFAIALHEAIRGRRLGFAALAAVNAALAALTGGRMGIGAGVVFALAYGLLDGGIRTRLARVPRPLAGFGLAAALVLFGWLLVQSYHEPADMLTMSGRDRLWARCLEQFRASPTFGHGVGATALVSSYFDLPHNVYLRLLVEGGVAGCLLYGGALLLWGRQVVVRAEPSERAFVYALLLALAVYALTDNLLTMPPALMPFLYLALMLGEPYAGRPPDRPAPQSKAEARGLSTTLPA